MSDHTPRTQVFLPYLVRATYDWAVDNDMTPYLLVNTAYPGVIVPLTYVKDGKIVLDIAPRAVNHLKISNEVVEFEARFDSKISFISVPIPSIISIYAREDGCGMTFHPTLSIDMSNDDIMPNPDAVKIFPHPNISLVEHQQSPPVTTIKKAPSSSAAKASIKPKLALVKKATKKTPEKPQDE